MSWVFVDIYSAIFGVLLSGNISVLSLHIVSTYSFLFTRSHKFYLMFSQHTGAAASITTNFRDAFIKSASLLR